MPTFLGVWSLGLFSLTFSPHPQKKTKKNLMYLLAINQALPYGCSFVTYGHPEGSAVGNITIIWDDVLK